ncbi:MAG: hypothetical protein IJV60_07640, partial [Prevotella sp.]|nr:hypothetical protein [Prevotella sp.]
INALRRLPQRQGAYVFLPVQCYVFLVAHVLFPSLAKLVKKNDTHKHNDRKNAWLSLTPDHASVNM